MPYAFSQDDYEKFSSDIIKAEGDQATLTALLADMRGTFTDAIAKDIASTEKVTTVEAENDRLRKGNMDLFLRLGEQNRQGGQHQPEEEKQLTTDEYMKKYFDSLDKK